MGLKRLVGTMFPANAWPVAGLTIFSGSPEKLPARSAAEGVVIDTGLGAERRCVSWAAKKKKVLFLRMGPPTVPPNWLSLNGGLVMLKKLRASRSVLRRNSNAVPWNSLEPERVDSCTSAPAPPYSAL